MGCAWWKVNPVGFGGEPTEHLRANSAPFWFAATGNGVLSLRLTATVFSLLALPAVFGLAWRLAGLPSRS